MFRDAKGKRWYCHAIYFTRVNILNIPGDMILLYANAIVTICQYPKKKKKKKYIYIYIYIYSRLHGLPEGLIMHDIIIIRDKLVLSFKLLRQLLSPECKKTS